MQSALLLAPLREGMNISVDGRAISRLFSDECQMKNLKNGIFRIMGVVNADFFIKCSKTSPRIIPFQRALTQYCRTKFKKYAIFRIWA